MSANGFFTIDASAVSSTGARLRSLGQHAAAGTPPGVPGCGSAAVLDAWDRALERLTWALHERLAPAVALWGGDVEAGATWCQERDGAVAGAYRSTGTDAELRVRLPERRSARGSLTSSGPRFTGSGGPGMLWDEEDPGRGDPSGAWTTCRWLDDYACVLMDLLYGIRTALPALAQAWTGLVGAALVEVGRRLEERLVRFAQHAGALATGDLCRYADRVRDLADRAALVRARREDALAEAQDAALARRALPTRQPTDGEIRRAHHLTALEDEAHGRARLATAQLADLAEERAAADRQAVTAADELVQAVAAVVPTDDLAFDGVSGLGAAGLSIRTVALTTGGHRRGSLDAERVALRALLAAEPLRGDELSALLAGLEDGSLQMSGLIAVLDALSAEDIDTLCAVIEYFHAIYPDDTLAFISSIIAGASPEQLERLTERLPFLEPELLDGDDWSMRTLVLFDPATIDGEQIGQNAVEDCWLIAGIGAVAAADIDRLRQNITANANGTYTVTIYRDGEAVRVTVTGYIPVGSKGRTRYAADKDDVPNWLSIYEKAAAQVLGGGSYDGLRAGLPSSGISAVTGSPTTKQPTNFLNPVAKFTDSDTFENIAEAVADGRPVSAITTFRGSDRSIAAWHVYYVIGIEDDRIVVQNPWGKDEDAGERETLRLTEDEFDQKFSWASIGVE
jgi:hypothetical protein